MSELKDCGELGVVGVLGGLFSSETVVDEWNDNDELPRA